MMGSFLSLVRTRSSLSRFLLSRRRRLHHFSLVEPILATSLLSGLAASYLRAKTHLLQTAIAHEQHLAVHVTAMGCVRILELWPSYKKDLPRHALSVLVRPIEEGNIGGIDMCITHDDEEQLEEEDSVQGQRYTFLRRVLVTATMASPLCKKSPPLVLERALPG